MTYSWNLYTSQAEVADFMENIMATES